MPILTTQNAFPAPESPDLPVRAYESDEFTPEEMEEEVPVIDYVTVLHGYGRLPANKVNYLDSYKFVGGVCKEVPKAVADAWKKIPAYRSLKVLPANSDVIDYAKAAGIRPMASDKLAAYINAADLDALREALGPDKTQKLIDALSARLAGSKRR